MDEKKETTNEDEFRFSEAEESTGTGLYTGDRNNDEALVGSRFNRRNILVAIGVVVVAFALYKFMEVFFGPGTVKKSSTVATAPVDTASAQPNIQIQSQSTNPELQDQLSKMQDNDAVTSQQMSSITDQLNTLGQAVDGLNNSVNQLNQQLQGMNDQLQTQQAAINTMQAKATKSTAKKHVSSSFRGPVFIRPKWYIQALIPGRAWLIAQSGQTVTVAVGDKLAGYGRVTNISVVSGIVKMSTGAIIQYRSM